MTRQDFADFVPRRMEARRLKAATGVQASWNRHELEHRAGSKPPGVDAPDLALNEAELLEMSPFAYDAFENPACGVSGACAVCGFGGRVVLCSSCPCVFHTQCHDPVISESLISETWQCKRCASARARFERGEVGEPHVTNVIEAFNKVHDYVVDANPVAFVLPETLFSLYVSQNASSDWLRCTKCNKQRRVLPNVLSECLPRAHRCGQMFWTSSASCSEPEDTNSGLVDNMRRSRELHRQVAYVYAFGPFEVDKSLFQLQVKDNATRQAIKDRAEVIERNLKDSDRPDEEAWSRLSLPLKELSRLTRANIGKQIMEQSRVISSQPPHQSCVPTKPLIMPPGRNDCEPNLGSLVTRGLTGAAGLTARPPGKRPAAAMAMKTLGPHDSDAADDRPLSSLKRDRKCEIAQGYNGSAGGANGEVESGAPRSRNPSAMPSWNSGRTPSNASKHPIASPGAAAALDTVTPSPAPKVRKTGSESVAGKANRGAYTANETGEQLDTRNEVIAKNSSVNNMRASGARWAQLGPEHRASRTSMNEKQWIASHGTLPGSTWAVADYEDPAGHQDSGYQTQVARGDIRMHVPFWTDEPLHQDEPYQGGAVPRRPFAPLPHAGAEVELNGNKPDMDGNANSASGGDWGRAARSRPDAHFSGAPADSQMPYGAVLPQWPAYEGPAFDPYRGPYDSGYSRYPPYPAEPPSDAIPPLYGRHSMSVIPSPYGPPYGAPYGLSYSPVPPYGPPYGAPYVVPDYGPGPGALPGREFAPPPYEPGLYAGSGVGSGLHRSLGEGESDYPFSQNGWGDEYASMPRSGPGDERVHYEQYYPYRGLARTRDRRPRSADPSYASSRYAPASFIYGPQYGGPANESGADHQASAMVAPAAASTQEDAAVRKGSAPRTEMLDTAQPAVTPVESSEVAAHALPEKVGSMGSAHSKEQQNSAQPAIAPVQSGDQAALAHFGKAGIAERAASAYGLDTARPSTPPVNASEQTAHARPGDGRTVESTASSERPCTAQPVPLQEGGRDARGQGDLQEGRHLLGPTSAGLSDGGPSSASARLVRAGASSLSLKETEAEASQLQGSMFSRGSSHGMEGVNLDTENPVRVAHSLMRQTSGAVNSADAKKTVLAIIGSLDLSTEAENTAIDLALARDHELMSLFDAFGAYPDRFKRHLLRLIQIRNGN
ncbi:hypothetical protein FVE85_4771 [Porphyridium purpureum]|uniref:PHD-type domain-containing protein n=1 Tax=Porphyridium purpureum TaxID=35688 RepID=A0A5J4YSF3_PORPP|nr:hypothetical protein FVE85_4771 [Porphyridium purpureum]|eukprot:POR4009..scf236_6